VSADELAVAAAGPAHRTTAVEFTPDAPCTHEFACGMVRGRVVVE
jgi:plastocyanin domain-containing protein